jgi:RNA polymerase sigma-70 factor (ECF subfamily)
VKTSVATTEDQTGDSELLSQVAAGDLRGAGNALAIRHYQPLYRKLLYWCDGNRDDAEELTQRVFEKVLRSAKDFRGESKFSTWLHTTARNTFIDFCRVEKSRVYVGLAEDQDEADEARQIATLVDETPSPETLLSIVKDKEAVHRALLQLKPIYKEVLMLRYFEDYAVEEIAQITGQKFETIRTRLRYAQDQLRHALRNLDSPNRATANLIPVAQASRA